ncbi:hypothetical protein [Streptomyces sp. NPDC059009]|uniref:hypothetical protein n=1 Tax=Streptomyces sp. NPDC059009 TaxID=3346694 RepID=UPI0036CBA4AB
MTDDSEFKRAFSIFRAMPYPGRPQTEKLQDWGLELLSLDTHVAGYAERVDSGELRAHDIPELEALARQVGTLRDTLAAVPVPTDRDVRLKEEYRTYVETLDRMMAHLLRLAAE